MYQASHTVARSLGQAAAASARLIEKCVDHAVTQLQAAEAQATRSDQRQEIADAWRELLARRKAVVGRFPQLLEGVLQAEASGRRTGGPANTIEDSSFATLTLVEEDEIARSIEASRLAQLLAAALERPLAELDALMSSALGLEVVQPERNPLRPSVYAEALRDTMAEAGPQPASMTLWLRQMARPLAQELEQLYRDQTHFLALENVHAASYRLNTVPSRPAPLAAAAGPVAGRGAATPGGGNAGGGGVAGGMAGGMAVAGDGAASGGGGAHAAGPGPAAAQAAATAAAATAARTAYAELPAQGLDGARLRRFLFGGDPGATRALAPGYYAQVDAELQALEAAADDAPAYDARAAQQHMHLPPVVRPQRQVDTDSPLAPEVWGAYAASRQRSLVHGRLKTQVRAAGQVFGLEVVRKLVNQVADDPRLLAPVREAIVALEPSLLRLAMVAPRFFSDEQHPGRLLVERVAERSFKFNDEFGVDFQGFFMPVAQAVQRLNRIESFEDAEPFRGALATLQAGWSAQDGLDEEAQRKLLDAVQFAERRQHEAARIAGDLGRREDLVDAPEAVQDFVLGPWTLVIAHARLTNTRPGVDPDGYLAVIADLLWSVQRELALPEPARAFELIPRVVAKLREGLDLLGHPPAESQTFFNRLESLHRPVLKLRARRRNGALSPLEQRTVIEEPARAPQEHQPDGLWLAPDEMRAAGFDTVPSDFAALPALPRATGAAPLDDLDAEQVLDTLAPGCWVDLYSRQQWRRAQLVWAAQKGTLFMFVSHPGQPHSMTRRSLQRLVQQGLLRTVASDGVVPRALEQLGQESAQLPLPA